MAEISILTAGKITPVKVTFKASWSFYVIIKCGATINMSCQSWAYVGEHLQIYYSAIIQIGKLHTFHH